MFRKLARRDRGFTMIEMMVVLIIIAILIGVGIRFYSGYIENSRVTKAKTQLATMMAGLDAYYAEKGTYPDPSKMDELLNAALQVEEAGAGGATLAMTDPWGQNYVYNRGNAATGTNNACVVHTGYNKVQNQDGYYVAGESANGELKSIEVTDDIDPDGK